MEGRARFAASSLNFIKQLSADIYQGMMLEELSKRARINIEELKKQIKISGAIAPEKLSPQPVEDSVAKIKLPAPARLAMSLLLQHPKLVALIKEPLPACQAPWYGFLSQLIQKIQLYPDATTGALLEHWRGEKEEKFLAKLVNFESIAPHDGLENEFLGAIRQLNLLSFDEEINQLLAKATQQGISDEEKQRLSTYIHKKKNLA